MTAPRKVHPPRQVIVLGARTCSTHASSSRDVHLPLLARWLSTCLTWFSNRSPSTSPQSVRVPALKTQQWPAAPRKKLPSTGGTCVCEESERCLLHERVSLWPAARENSRRALGLKFLLGSPVADSVVSDFGALIFFLPPVPPPLFSQDNRVTISQPSFSKNREVSENPPSRFFALFIRSKVANLARFRHFPSRKLIMVV